jgi:hypothetical protein
MILHFQKKVNIIMYNIEKINKFESFYLQKISIRYEISKFMFL